MACRWVGTNVLSDILVAETDGAENKY
jgi:hypothetical protein